MFKSTSKKLRLSAALSAIRDLIDAHAIDELKIRAALKTDPRGDVFDAELLGERVIVKRYKSLEVERQTSDAATELGYLRDHMAHGQNRATAARAVWPKAGVIALSVAPGITFTQALEDASRPTRDALFRRAGEWAYHYGQGRRDESEIAPRFWVKKAAGLDRGALSPVQLATMRALMVELRRMVPALQDVVLPRGAVHGDLIGANLLVEGETLTGVDINATLIRPLVWEAAHFLVWQALRPPYPTGRAAFLEQIRHDKAAFLDGHSGVEQGDALIFFLLYQCCVRLVAYAGDETRADALTWLIEEVLA